MIQHLFHLSDDESLTLQQRVYKSISNAILDGHISPDIPLPSTRQLSKMLSVSRNTVIIAYQNLTADGYLLPKERSGHFVDSAILKTHSRSVNGGSLTIRPIPKWEHLTNLHVSSASEEQLNDWRSYPYPFIYGQLDPELFPFQHWRECCLDSARVLPTKAWLSDHYDRDDPLLIQEIKKRLLPRRGIWVDDEQILITVGAQNAIFTILQALLKSTSVLGIENPGYPDLYKIAKLSGARTKPLPIDHEGLIINGNLSECDLIFTTPSHQFPTNVTLPLERRKQLLHMADEHNFLIIEDDYESEISFESLPLPALKSLDTNGRVIYIGSISKTLSPGLRLGYIVADKSLIKILRELRTLMMRHPAMNNQHAVGLFIERGYHHSLINKLIAVYRERWEIMNHSLQKHLPDCQLPTLQGGSAAWITGPQELDSHALKTTAANHGILIESGTKYYSGSHVPRNNFRLGYSSIKTTEINDGIARLAKLTR